MLIDAALTFYSVTTVGLLAYKAIKNIKPVKQSPYILSCKNITFDMTVAPHILVAGLSGQGKTKFVEYLFYQRIDIKELYLINAFKEDFKRIKCKRINNTTKILEVLRMAYTHYTNYPKYIIVDELLELAVREPKIIKELTKALAVARHYNTYFVCIAQQATKEEVKCKSLFNCRVSFKQIEYSSYTTILGYSPEEKALNQREFYYLSDCGIGRGKVPKV